MRRERKGVKKMPEVQWYLQRMCDQVYATPVFLSEKSWMYDDGVVLVQLKKIYDTYGDDRFLDLLNAYCQRFVKNGMVPFVEPRPLSLDNMNNAKVVFDAYQLTGDPGYKACLDWFLQLYEKHPRIEETNGLWHKVRYPNQMWLDGLYMLHPFLAEYGAYFGKPELYEDIAHQFFLVQKYLYDEETGLYYHAYDHSKRSFWCDKKTGCSPNFWGRSLGWLGMACVDILEVVPPDNRMVTEPVRVVLEHLAEGIEKWQDKEKGVWYQLTALPKEPGNYLEGSCSAMFVYTLLKGMRLGVLPKRFMKAAAEGVEGLIKEFYREEGGRIEMINICQVAGLGPEKSPERNGSVSYYLSEPIVSNDKKGYGAMLGALYEWRIKI